MAGLRAQQKDQTRQALISQARRLFATNGYAGVALAEIVQSAGVTKGALYHHFGGKTELFRAVLEEVQQEVAQQVSAVAESKVDPWEQFLAGCEEFLAASTGPERQRIMLIDGPAVLGWNEWRAMDEAGSAQHLAEALTALAESGIITPQPIAPLTHLLSGAMNEAALWLATSGSPQDLADTTAALRRLLESLLTTP
jgi:AcrR family transcriptional regulator